ncbi:MAG TPA: hypothetical protein VJP82_00155 [Sphingomicrobium sp.]|jgi:hypothetical protein|nr:hypothetical protein [Sphingomicrobium sp.]
MDARTAERIESVVDAAAASLLAGAVGYAVYKLAIAQAAVAGAGVAFGLSFAGLRRVQPAKNAPVADGPAATPVGDLLAEADRSLAHEEDELVLDDILAALNPDSRVVRLFERDAMPAPRAAADASQDLHDALAELRRSLN